MDSWEYSAAVPLRAQPSRSLMRSHSLPSALPFFFIRTSVHLPRSL